MKGDFTRSTFDPTKGYSSVRQQQGRVQLDADWNEQVEIGDRLRETSTKGSIISLSCVPEFYLAGRQTLIELGLMRATDALDDLVFVQDFAERVNLAYHRNHAHVLP